MGFVLADAAVAVASAVIWWVARKPAASPSRLLTLSLIYEVVVCFMIAFTSMWQWYLDKGTLPPLTWAPTIIVLFPLIMPGPPRRMLAAAIVAARCRRWRSCCSSGGARSRPARRVLPGGARPLRRRLRLLGRPGRVRTRPPGGRGAGAGELPAGGAAGPGRHGRGLAGPAPHARAPGGDQAHPALARRRRRRREELQRRFEQEAQAIARLRSPHTVSCSTSGSPPTAPSTT